ncbi:MAG: hypothetical protein R6V54_13800 [Desulfobacteraceae bacterium]
MELLIFQIIIAMAFIFWYFCSGAWNSREVSLLVCKKSRLETVKGILSFYSINPGFVSLT